MVNSSVLRRRAFLGFACALSALASCRPRKKHSNQLRPGEKARLRDAPGKQIPLAKSPALLAKYRGADSAGKAALVEAGDVVLAGAGLDVQVGHMSGTGCRVKPLRGEFAGRELWVQMRQLRRVR